MAASRERAGAVGWSALDQVLSSGGNMLLTVFAARVSTPDAFGAYALSVATYVFGVSIVRAVCSEPLLVRYSGEQAHDQRAAVQSAMQAVFALGLLGAVGAAAAGLMFDGVLGAAMLALALALPPLLSQEAWRFGLFCLGLPKLAAMNDALLGALLVVGLLALFVTGTATVPNIIVVWGGAALFALGLGYLSVPLWPRPPRLSDWVLEHRRLIGPYTVEFVVINASLQIAYYFIGWIAGLRAVGALRAAQVLFGPLTVLFSSATIIGLESGVRVRKDRPQGLGTWVRLVAVTIMVVAISWVALVILLPDRYGTLVLGSNWFAASELLAPVGLARLAEALGVAAFLGLRVLEALRQSMQIRLLLAALILLGGTVGAAMGAAHGAAFGILFAAATASALYWLALRSVWPNEEQT